VANARSAKRFRSSAKRKPQIAERVCQEKVRGQISVQNDNSKVSQADAHLGEDLELVAILVPENTQISRKQIHLQGRRCVRDQSVFVAEPVWLLGAAVINPRWRHGPTLMYRQPYRLSVRVRICVLRSRSGAYCLFRFQLDEHADQ
jgi:hypothetical protein